MALWLHILSRARRNSFPYARAASREPRRPAKAVTQRAAKQRPTRQLAACGLALRWLRSLYQRALVAGHRKEQDLSALDAGFLTAR